MKPKIEIERLLQWALREELPKGRGVSAEIGAAIRRHKAARPGMIARSLDHQRESDPLGYVPGAPHADAELIAAAIADLPTDATIESEHDARALFGDLAPIAEACISPLLRSQFNAQAIVTACAAMGRRPRWQFDQPRAYQIFMPTPGRPRALVYGIDADGNRAELIPNRGRKAQRELYDLAMSPRSPIEWGDPSPLKIGEARAEYVAWHSALVRLAADLADQLTGCDPLPPAAAAMPWITGEHRRRVIVVGPAHSAPVGLPLTPARPPSRPPLESPRASAVRYPLRQGVAAEMPVNRA
ncbi:hypothetical protein [Rhodopseudomonas sp. BR0G17]|uniref:hypothetical protein n=1 Tax=Rhodopseudomonas sp. BR0G17 TaxID=2269368 RepID=UPI0013DFEC3D|nr:hypothetical protein [Rhodopseudomonas sp. BR0G17]NEW96627.1 hypothetical protein [Rhodopseudomonas sp. BR0G17]